MAEFARPPAGPDLSQGVPVTTVHASGVVPGHVGGDPVRLSLIGGGMFAVSATCTHCGAPLGAGLIVDDEVRCPWHRACFSLRSGHALKAPAFAALATWRVERVGDDVFVRNDNEPGASAPALRPNGAGPQRIVSIGGGAAAFAAADRLRALGYQGSLSMLSADASAPYDRPNLSKNFLAGTVPEDCLALRPRGCYVEPGIEPHLWCGVTAIDVTAREVTPRAGARFASDVLLVATGAEPVRLPTPGFDRRNVFLLPTLEDARAVIAAASGAASAVLIVGGLIGLEAAGALRTRGLAVHVVMRDAVPMVRPGRGIRPVPAGRAPAARRGVPCAGRYHRARWRVRAPGRRNAHPRGPRHRLYRRQATRHAPRSPRPPVWRCTTAASWMGAPRLPSRGLSRPAMSRASHCEKSLHASNIRCMRSAKDRSRPPTCSETAVGSGHQLIDSGSLVNRTGVSTQLDHRTREAALLLRADSGPVRDSSRFAPAMSTRRHSFRRS